MAAGGMVMKVQSEGGGGDGGVNGKVGEVVCVSVRRWRPPPARPSPATSGPGPGTAARVVEKSSQGPAVHPPPPPPPDQARGRQREWRRIAAKVQQSVSPPATPGPDPGTAARVAEKSSPTTANCTMRYQRGGAGGSGGVVLGHEHRQHPGSSEPTKLSLRSLQATAAAAATTAAAVAGTNQQQQQHARGPQRETSRQ